MALVEPGDWIEINAETGTITLEVPEDELTRRKALWHAPPPNYPSGALFKYACLVGSASQGAVTHPGLV